ncbi:hypothetical protein ABZ845_30215 [Streptomyces sp. NPDC047022]|uniref:hypothetical protein n=1 Tax=Streptomyces sp. NPDC047022 TaxID=3155737 RepID=UPI0033D87056
MCEKFAHAIDQAHSEFEHKVSEAGIAIGLTTAVGVLGTLFTLGGSDAGAVALDAGEAAALFASVDGILDAAMADYAAEGVAELETVLASAAEDVPEVEAVDAETTEVSQALDREMATTEARSGGGGRGGGGGGGKPPTGGGEPPPEEPQGGGTGGRDVHGANRVGQRGVDVDHVWQNGDLYIQEDGQMVRVLDNGNGTYDVVVRDPANPSGGPTTVLKDATERYVQNKIESGKWS